MFTIMHEDSDMFRHGACLILPETHNLNVEGIVRQRMLARRVLELKHL